MTSLLQAIEHSRREGWIAAQSNRREGLDHLKDRNILDWIGHSSEWRTGYRRGWDAYEEET